MNTKRLVTVAVLIALYTVLSLFSANLGLIKLTFESFPVLVASLMFGWVDGLLVGAVGGLLNQMLTYGFTVTTLPLENPSGTPEPVSSMTAPTSCPGITGILTIGFMPL